MKETFTVSDHADRLIDYNENNPADDGHLLSLRRHRTQRLSQKAKRKCPKEITRAILKMREDNKNQINKLK